jgi:integrase/recombinase XerD
MNAIYTRQKNEIGQWRYKTANIGRGRRPVNLQGPFYTRILGPGKKDPSKQVQSWTLLDGDNLDAAIKSADTIGTALEAKSKGLSVAEADSVDGTNRLPTKIAAFCEETKANKAKKTWQAYSNSLAYFAESCTRTNVQNIKREDLLTFKTYLRSEGMSDRSVYNNFLNTMVFLKWCGIKTAVKKEDWPKKPEREPEEYTDEEITKLFEAADAEERLLLKCFLSTGLRSGEMAHLTYGDIDFKHSVWTVQPKKGWATKTDSSQRDVPAPEWLTKMIHTRMEKNNGSKAALIFPNTEGKPNGHLLRIVKRVAKRAKVVGRVDDHKFRSTAITRWLREGNTVADVMAWVGHTSLETILRYATKVKIRQAETRKKAESAFTKFANVGD